MEHGCLAGYGHYLNMDVLLVHHFQYLNKVVFPVSDSPSGITFMMRFSASSCLSSGVK